MQYHIAIAHIEIECYVVGCASDNNDVAEEVEKLPAGEQRPPLPPGEFDLELVSVECSHGLEQDML